MKRKLLSLMLVLSMVLVMLAGCGSDDKKSDDSSKKEEKEQSSGEDEPYTVAIQLVNISADLSEIEMVEEAINEITVPAINTKVKIQNLYIGDLLSTTSMNIVSNDKMDIICVGLTQKLESIASDGILLELDDYLQYAPTLVSLVEEYMAAGQVDGVQLAVPGNAYPASGQGFVYNKEMAEEYGITLNDGDGYEELEAAFAKLAENGIYGTSNGSAESMNMQFWYNVELYGTNGDYGMIADPVNNTKVENVFASDMFREFCEKMKAWKEAGYMPSDSLTDTTTVQEHFSAGNIFGTVTNYDIAEVATWSAGKDFEVGIIQLEEAIVATSTVTERMWGIASNSENPQKAMEFLNYIFENEDVANLLMYGVEGQHYTIAEGTERVVTTEGAVTGSEGYTSMFCYYGDISKTLPAYPNTDEYGEQVLAYNDGVEKAASFGYIYDVSNFSAEAGAVSNVLAEYLPRLQTGQIDDLDTYLGEFLSALDNAGYNDIIEDNQAQMDAYMAH